MSTHRTGFDAAKLSDKDWKGEDVKFDKTMAQRPSDKNRRCTDAFCCIFFSVFLAGMLTCTIWGYAAGDIYKLMAPIAQDGQICGFGDAEGYDYLYIEDVTAALSTDEYAFDHGVCVKQCPTSPQDTVECVPACTSTNVVYTTYELFGYCAFTKDDLPADAQQYWERTVQSFNNSYAGSAFTDIYGARWVVYLSPLLAVLLTFGYIYFMDKCAYYLSWISVVIIELTLIGTGVYCLLARQARVEGMT